MLKKNVYLSHFVIFNGFIINKFFSKYVYTKFLIKKKCLKKKKINYISIDNFFDNFFFCLKKKYKKISLKVRLKTGFFLKSELFIYKHSKLKFYNFSGIKFKSYKKKNIYLNLNVLNNSFSNFGLLFVYKSVRGGFLGFSNKIVGFLTLKHFILFKKDILFYKKYLVIESAACIPYNITNFPGFSLYTSGLKRHFAYLKKKSLSKFYFKRFKFIFSSKKYFFKKYLKYFLQFFFHLKLYYFNFIFNYLLLKLIYFLKS